MYVWMLKSTKKFVDKTGNASIDNVHVGSPVRIDGQQRSQYSQWSMRLAIFNI